MTYKETYKDDGIEGFLEELKWKLPYDENDIRNAIKLSRDLTIKEISGKMVLLPINGVAQAAITETMLKEIK